MQIPITISDKYIHSTAHRMLRQHGDEAEFEAVIYYNEQCNQGNVDGAAVWERVIKAIRVLQTVEPERCGPVH